MTFTSRPGPCRTEVEGAADLRLRHKHGLVTGSPTKGYGAGMTTTEQRLDQLEQAVLWLAELQEMDRVEPASDDEFSFRRLNSQLRLDGLAKQLRAAREPRDHPDG